MLLPVRCKPLRKRPSQLWLATWAAGLLGALGAEGVFRLKMLNMGGSF
jgi:hypothetical protein